MTILRRSHADSQTKSSSDGKIWRKALSSEGMENPGVYSRSTQFRVSELRNTLVFLTLFSQSLLSAHNQNASPMQNPGQVVPGLIVIPTIS